MAGDRTVIVDLVEKQADGDLVRKMLAIAADPLTVAQVWAVTGAAKGMRPTMRVVRRAGYRNRDRDPRAGRIAPALSHLPTCSCCASFLGRLKAERALIAMIKEACVHGVSVGSGQRHGQRRIKGPSGAWPPRRTQAATVPSRTPLRQDRQAQRRLTTPDAGGVRLRTAGPA